MRILIVDDHEEVARSIAGLLTEFGHECGCAAGGEEALEVMAIRPADLVLSDVRMPGMDGPTLLRRLQERWPDLLVAMMTAFGEEHTALEMVRMGAVDYFRKPIDIKELLALIERVEEQFKSGERPQIPDDEGAIGEELADGLIVHSASLATLIRRCDRVHGMPEVPVLIEGETGTGKELIARRVHHGGTPADAGPFVALNCAAISPELFEAELFGYAPGAFTGARAGGAKGKLALAAGGTVFLDEIGDLPADQQAKLLRVLESRRWFPVGGEYEEHLHARIVCASNLDLLEQVATGQFREDLFYRLKVMRLRLPALREDPASVGILAPRMLRRLAQRITESFIDIESPAMELLTGEEWPGNIRQLWHALEAICIESGNGGVMPVAVVREYFGQPGNSSSSQQLRVPSPGELAAGHRRRTSGAIIRPDTVGEEHPQQATGADDPDWLHPTADMLPEGRLDMDAWQAAIVKAALEKHDNSPVKTAQYLGLTRKVLYTLRKRHGLMDED